MPCRARDHRGHIVARIADRANELLDPGSLCFELKSISVQIGLNSQAENSADMLTDLCQLGRLECSLTN